MEIIIHLIRHGSTSAIEANQYCGKTDIDISPKGHRGLLAYKDEGLYPHADYFFTSRLTRTKTSLGVIFGDVSSKEIKEFDEQDLGALELKPYKEVKANPLYFTWINDKTGDVKCPGGGESLNDFKLRVKLGIYKLIEEIKSIRSDKSSVKVAVITHGSVIAIIMNSIFHYKNAYKGWQPKPARGYVIYYNDTFTNYTYI